jgi:uncharacterized protein
MIYKLSGRASLALFLLSFLIAGMQAFAQDGVIPGKPNPPRLVNDFAHVLNSQQISQLEAKLVEYDKTTSTQITIVTVPDLGGRDVADYSLDLFNKWGIGQKDKGNGVLLLAAIKDRKAWITVGKGLEGALTDIQSAHIFRNEIVPAFREERYYDGLANASDAIIAATKGEYTADGKKEKKGIPAAGIIVLVIFILYILKMFRGGGGGGRGGGDYMSGRGFGNLATGWLLGSLLSGGRGHRGGGWGGGSDWGGGFGGFGGGSSGGGGAGGSW